jgi:hypothetical protein
MADKTYNDAALEQLNALIKIPGALRIITRMHKCQQSAGDHMKGAVDPSDAGFDQALCDTFEFPTTDPRHFVWHDVENLEVTARGRIRVYSAPYATRAGRDGRDFTEGYAGDVLRRLMEHGQT